MRVQPVLLPLDFNLGMQYFIVIVEVLGEAAGGQISDLLIEGVRNRQTVLFKDVEEKDQLVFSLLAIVDVLL